MVSSRGSEFEVQQDAVGNTFYVRELSPRNFARRPPEESVGEISNAERDVEFKTVLQQIDAMQSDIRKTQQETQELLKKLRK